MVLWSIAVLAAALAGIAYLRMRIVARRLESLTKSYWELRYEFSRLRAQVARLDPEPSATPDPEPPAAEAPSVAFVPLSSLKRN